MKAWYACFFALAVLALGAGGLLAFRELELTIANAPPVTSADVAWPQDSIPVSRPFAPIAPDPDEFARYEADDAAWRARDARQFTLSELRARGDGRRTARDSLDDRVYEYTRRGDRARAIAELERWMVRSPGDKQALLSLARLLDETGRNADAIAELERWVVRNPGDEQALLSLARLLNETGRNADAITRYRALLAVMKRSGGE